MPRRCKMKCYFGCNDSGPFHAFPNPESVIVEQIERFNDWKAVLDLDIQKIGDRKIYNNVRLCGNHFEDCFKLPSGRLTQNSRPTLFCNKQYPNNKIDESLDTSETRDNVDSWDIKNGNNKVEHVPKELPPRILYKIDAGPPSCAVKIIADIIGLEFAEKECDFFKLEHKSPDFLELNPLGTLPTITDGKFVLSDSNAIMKYLLSKYGKELEESLYPSDIESRALVDQALFFNAGVFFIRLKAIALPTVFGSLQEPTAKHLEDIESAYGVIEAYLRKHHYIATDHLTIADIAVGCTAFALRGVLEIDENKFPGMIRWLQILSEVPKIKKHGVSGGDLLADILRKQWKKNKNVEKIYDIDISYGIS